MTPPKALVTVRNLIAAITSRLQWLPPLLVRLSLGILFISTGWAHLHSLPGLTDNFREWHIPAPHFNAIFSSVTELVGGGLILVGLATRFAAAALVVVMAVAIVSAKLSTVQAWPDFFGLDELAYLLMFLWLAVRGAGAVSLDRLIARPMGLEINDDKPATLSANPR